MDLRDCPIEPNKYWVSSAGDIINKKTGYKRKWTVDKRGYPRVSIYTNSKSKKYDVHRLVALAFIENPENKKFVNHIDGNKLNANVDNLEWCTAKENVNHAVRTGLHVTANEHPRGKMTIEQAWEAWGRIQKGESPKTVGRSYGVAISTLHGRFQKMFGKCCPDVTAAKKRANQKSHEAKRMNKLLSEICLVTNKE